MSQPPTGVLQSGPLKKRSPKGFLGLHMWQERYFVLWEHQLCYYKRKEDVGDDSKCLGFLLVENMSGVVKDKKHADRFNIVLEGVDRQFELAADSDVLAVSWYDAIQTVLKKYGRAPVSLANTSTPSGGSLNSTKFWKPKIHQKLQMQRRQAIMAEPMDTLDVALHAQRTFTKTPAEKALIMDALQRCLAFKIMDQAAREEICSLMWEASFSAGDVVYTEGQSASVMYVVTQGSFDTTSTVKTSAVVPPPPPPAARPSMAAPPTAPSTAAASSELFQALNNEDLPAPEAAGTKSGVLSAGQWFGELALLYESLATHTITALEPARCFAIDRAHYKKLIATASEQRFQRRVEFLRTTALLSQLPDALMKQVAEALEERVFAPGEAIIHQDEIGDALYIIQAGEASAMRDGRELHRYTQPGEYFGEKSLVRKEARGATITAVTHVSVLYLLRGDFVALLGRLEETTKNGVRKYSILNRELELADCDIADPAHYTDADLERPAADADADTEEAPLPPMPSFDAAMSLPPPPPAMPYDPADDTTDNLPVPPPPPAEPDADIPTLSQIAAASLPPIPTLADLAAAQGPGGAPVDLAKTPVPTLADLAAATVAPPPSPPARAPLPTVPEGSAAGIPSPTAKPRANTTAPASTPTSTTAKPRANTTATRTPTSARTPATSPTAATAAAVAACPVRSLADLRVVGTLGRGTFGHVQLVADKDENTYALKAVNKTHVVRHNQVPHILSERAVMVELDHPFIVKLHRTMHDKNYVYFLLEPALGGELFSLLRIADRFDNDTARFYAAIVVVVFQYLHNRDVLYRDLKPENLLIDQQGYIKFTDFGFAKKTKDRSYTFCGTPEYLPPEIISGSGHFRGVDFWALGVLIYEMLVGYTPFYDDAGPTQMYSRILAGKVFFPPGISPAAQDIIRGLLQPKPTRRLGVLLGGAEVIKNHPWFRGFDWNALLKKTMPAPIPVTVKDKYDISNFDTYDDDIEEDEYIVDPTNPDWDKVF